MNKLNVKALGLALGTLEAAVFFVFAILAGWLNWGMEWMDLTATIFKGYSTSFGGAIIGAIWGFVDGFIGGSVLAWLYNKLA